MGVAVVVSGVVCLPVMAMLSSQSLSADLLSFLFSSAVSSSPNAHSQLTVIVFFHAISASGVINGTTWRKSSNFDPGLSAVIASVENTKSSGKITSFRQQSSLHNQFLPHPAPSITMSNYPLCQEQ